jgi:hypothetical protein
MTYKYGNKRAALELRIMKYRSLARRVLHHETARRIHLLVAEMERALIEIDE